MESYVRLLFWNAKVIKPKSFETLVLSKQEDRRTFCFADNWSGNPFCGTAFGRMAKIVDQLDLHEGDSISGECEISFSCKVVNGKKIFNSNNTKKKDISEFTLSDLNNYIGADRKLIINNSH